MSSSVHSTLASAPASAVSARGEALEAVDESTTWMAGAMPQARRAAAWWSAQSIAERANWLGRYRDRILDHLEQVVEMVGRETQKPRFDCVNEVMQSCMLLSYLEKHAAKFLRPRRVGSGFLIHKRAEIHYRPRGVVVIITPWNYPVVLVLSPLFQALMAGNAVILKPSEHTTGTARLLHQLFVELQPQEAVFQLATGGPAMAQALARGGVDKIFFTGGPRGGRAIMAAAAENLTPVVLELGGKDAMIVHHDADLDRAAHAAVWGSFLNCGQSCIAIERCFVHESVYEVFVDKVVDAAQALSQGPTRATSPSDSSGPDWDHDVGGLITRQQFLYVKELLADALAQGATVRLGGLPREEDAPFFPPTILTGLRDEMRILHEETFGPVLPILPVRNLDDAIALTNASPYGLAASIWTRDIRLARRLALQLQVGGVVINDCLLHFGICSLPFGGVKQSGFGRTHGQEGFLEYCATQTITTHRFGPRLEFHWFPYRDRYKLLERALRWIFRGGWARFRRPKVGAKGK